MTAAERSKATKKALVPIFGREHVSVKNGRGTVYGWITAHVYLPKPADCSGDHGFGQCGPCRETRWVAQRVIDKATEGIDYGTYCSDDGYNTRYTKFSVHIHFDHEFWV